MTRQRGFKPKSAKSKSAREALDQKAIEALVAAFPGRGGQFHQVSAHGQSEAHWEGSAHAACDVGWCDKCEPVCSWGCCHCECSCHVKE